MAKKIHDIEITRSETYDNDIELTTDSENISLEGKTAKAQIRPEKESNELTAEFSCVVDAQKNTIHLSLTSEQTTAIQPGTYAYDVFLLGERFSKCYLGGKFIVDGRSTIIEEESSAEEEN